MFQKATWWLLLEPRDTGFKPSKFTSFNPRYDKLNVPRTAGYQPFRTARCTIVAKGFGETEFEQRGNKNVPKHYHDVIAYKGAIAFGGLYKEYVNKQSAEVSLGCSIITLAPHPKLANIHSTSSPLMLLQEDALDAWLDTYYQQIDSK